MNNELLASENTRLQNELAIVHADISVVANTVHLILDELNIDPSKLTGNLNLASILSSVMPKLLSGDINPTIIESAKELPEILERYSNLVKRT